MIEPKLLLCAVFKPYGIEDGYAEAVGMQMELFNNQITREQDIHSPRHNFWTFPLYFLAENISVPTTVLDFPSWDEFRREVAHGYTHVGISFIQTNVMKARRMALHIRAHHPDVKILLGGYGTCIPNVRELVPCDAVCPGEGVAWLRAYFGEDAAAPVRHPIMHGVARKHIYGFRDITDDSAVIFPGLGCTNACSFCSTSGKFGHKYIAYLPTGRSVFDVCTEAESRLGVQDFAVIDENFLKQPGRAADLLAEMEAREKPYTFAMFSSAETITQLGVDFLVRLGVVLVWIGTESRKALFDKLRGIDVPGLIRSLQAHGISTVTSSILFLEHHDRTTLQQDIDWAIGLGSEFHQFMQLTPLPGTPLHAAYEADGRLLPDVSYPKMSGLDWLTFRHPHFAPHEAFELTRDAFRRKYEAGGAGVLRMARTVVRGYRKMCEDIERRRVHGLSWNPKSLGYDMPGGNAVDHFMELRREKMRSMALAFRPLLLAGSLFGPNREATSRARELAREYRLLFGRERLPDLVKSGAVVATSAVELLRMRMRAWARRGELVRQPPSRTVRFNVTMKETDRCSST